MRVAIAHWQGRVSPVFDVAGRVLLVDWEGGREVSRQDVRLMSRDPCRRASEVSGLGTDVLLCGAVSQTLERALASAGIRVVGFVRGELEEVLTAFARGQLTDGRDLGSGCVGHRRRSRLRRHGERGRLLGTIAKTSKRN